MHLYIIMLNSDVRPHTYWISQDILLNIFVLFAREFHALKILNCWKRKEMRLAFRSVYDLLMVSGNDRSCHRIIAELGTINPEKKSQAGHDLFYFYNQSYLNMHLRRSSTDVSPDSFFLFLWYGEEIYDFFITPCPFFDMIKMTWISCSWMKGLYWFIFHFVFKKRQSSLTER